MRFNPPSTHSTLPTESRVNVASTHSRACSEVPYGALATLGRDSLP